MVKQKELARLRAQDQRDIKALKKEMQRKEKAKAERDEAKEVAGMLPACSTAMLVTSASHKPRARRLYERQGFIVLPFAEDFQASGAWAGHSLRDPLNHLPTLDGLKSSSRALREAICRTIYRSW